MCQLCDKQIENVWLQLSAGESYQTPDIIRSKNFIIQELRDDQIHISPQNIVVKKSAFIGALHYLRIHGHGKQTPCEIRSNNKIEDAGPLCRASRIHNGNVRCINYILPILRKFGVIEIDTTRPNKTWISQMVKIFQTTSDGF